jgi:NADH-quinone oxidoreductase subunit L
MTGEAEDTDVGFPGPEHHIAERAGTMRAAMTALAGLSIVGGIVAIPNVTHWLERFLDPSFSDSMFRHPSTSHLVPSLVLGGVIAVTGIAVAYTVWVRRPGTATQLQRRLAPVYRLLVNKWYVDELIDLLFVRPAAWLGRFAAQTFERVFVQGTLVDGTVGLVRAGSAAVRAAQTGFVRYYAGLLILGVTAIGLYFLLQS